MSRFAIIYFLPLTKNAREILLHFLSYYINFRRLLWFRHRRRLLLANLQHRIRSEYTLPVPAASRHGHSAYVPPSSVRLCGSMHATPWQIPGSSPGIASMSTFSPWSSQGSSWHIRLSARNKRNLPCHHRLFQAGTADRFPVAHHESGTAHLHQDNIDYGLSHNSITVSYTHLTLPTT